MSTSATAKKRAAMKKAEAKAAAKAAKQRDRDLQALRDIADDVIESDFVPYACLLDPHTIVTKDGELLQTLKITGASGDDASSRELRKALRKAVRDTLPDSGYAIWLHTLRRKQAAAAEKPFPDAFSQAVNQAWGSRRSGITDFVNELYVTVVKAGESSKFLDKHNLIQSLIPKRDRIRRTQALDTMNGELTRAVDAMQQAMGYYGAKRLGIVEREGVMYSEQLEFLEKLTNLEARPMEVPVRDLSQVLTSGEITFGFNAMEVRTAAGVRRFAALMTLKEYKESTLAGIDQFLEIPCEIIISQCFNFIENEAARESYAKQARYLAMSKDKELAQWMEIDRLTDPKATDEGKDFGEQQTLLFLIAPSVAELEVNVRLVRKAMARLGMVIVREDLRFEECYWSLLPGNFQFVVRKMPVDTDHIAGFANLQAVPMGNREGSAWGPPVTMLYTAQRSPYFFNFQRGETAHTVLLGKRGTDRTQFLHFLLAQSRKLPVSIWYLDGHGEGKPFIEAMGGQYLTAGRDLALNPFSLPETPANREFLAMWVSTLVDPSGQHLTRDGMAYYQSLVDQVLALPREQRRLSALLPIAMASDAGIGAAIQTYCEGGVYGTLFDSPTDNFLPGQVSGWDVSRQMGRTATRVPLASYLLHRLTNAITGMPTLLVMGEGFELMDNPLFGSRAGEWCDYVNTQQVAAIFTTADIARSGGLALSSAISKRAATLFAMADTHPDAEYQMAFGCRQEEMGILAYMAANRHQILQKRGEETLLIQMDYSLFPAETLATLNGEGGQAAAAALTPAEELAILLGIKSA